MIPKPVKKEKKPRRYIRVRSKKRAAQERKYRQRVKEWIEGKRCAVFPELRATQCHHQKGRIGDLLLNEDFWLPVSGAGHVFIHQYPKVAYEKGWSILRTNC